MSSLLEEFYESVNKSKRLLVTLNMQLEMYWEGFISNYNEYFQWSVCEDNCIIKLFINDGVVNGEFLTVYYEDFINEFDLKLIGVNYTHKRSKENSKESYEYMFAHTGNEYFYSMNVDDILI